MRFETIAVHAAADPDETTGAIAPAIHLSTTFERTADGKTPRGFGYIRESNPTQLRLESALAAVEGGSAALVFSSGMAAAAAVFQTLPRGSHVLLPEDGYYTVRVLARDYFPVWSLEHEFVPLDDPAAMDRALSRETALVCVESPSNPLLKVVDLRRLAEHAHRAGARLLVDGTFATPALQRPLELGADLVLHSTTKALGGHSDVQGGAIVFREPDALFESVLHAREVLGAVASPFNSWLVLRGLRTLAARVRVQCENARRVADFLEAHPRVEAVHYPGLASHPGHEIARAQMEDFGGMVSFGVRGGADDAIAVVGRTHVFVRATSLGGVESLIEHRASSEGPGSTAPPNLIRLSLGLEHSRDLIDDLAQALGSATVPAPAEKAAATTEAEAPAGAGAVSRERARATTTERERGASAVGGLPRT